MVPSKNKITNHLFTPSRNLFHEDMGTLQSPKILKITFGEKDKKSLIFHCKVESNFYCYRMVEVNMRTVNIICLNHQRLQYSKKKDSGCLARAKISVTKDGLIQKRTVYTRRDGRIRNTFSVDFSDGRILDPKNYTVVYYDSQPHNQSCKVTF